MTRRERTQQKIERLELHAQCLLAKVACGPRPTTSNHLRIRRPAAVDAAQRLFERARALRENLGDWAKTAGAN